jgi:class 3 adenylate cyclase
VGYAYLDAKVMAFRARDLDLLMVMAHHAATEIARLELVEQVRQEEERRRRLLRFLPESVAGMLGADGQGDALSRLDERLAILVHVESTGLNEMSSRLAAVDVQHFLDAHLERLVGIAVDEHGGTLHRVTVSGIRLVFGAPVARGADQDAHAALRAALAMRDAVETLRKAEAAYASVRLRIGAHAGRVVAGMMGPERRQEYSVVGAAVDETARVTLACPPGRVLVTSECLELAPAGAFATVPAPDRRVPLAGGPARCWWVVREA